MDNFDLPKTTPEELIEDLRDLAREDFVELYPQFETDELWPAQVADFLEASVKLLREIVAEGGPHAARAQRVLDRAE